MYVQFTVKEYGVKFTNFKLPYAYIMLFDEEENWRVRLDFCPLAEVNTTTDVTINGDFIQLYMNIKLLDSVVDLLRNEKPLYVSTTSDGNTFILSASREPVGEEETLQFSRFAIPYTPS